MALHDIVEVTCVQSAGVNLFRGLVKEQVIKSRACLFWLKLSYCPLKLASVLQLIKMQVSKRGILNSPPDLFVIELCFECKVQC